MNLLHYDCLPISMLLYIMLYIMPDYLMLFAALSNAVCLYNGYLLFAIGIYKCFFVFMLFPRVIDT